MRAKPRRHVLVALASLTTACSGPESAPPPSTSVSASSTSSTSTGGGSDALTVLVTIFGAKPVPVVGATVALDPATGSRQERTTGADGTAHFASVDLTSGSGSVIAAAPECGFAARVGVHASDGQVDLALVPAARPSNGVELSVQIANPWDLGFASTTVLGGDSSKNLDFGGTFSLTVPPATPLTVVAFDWTLGSDMVSDRGVSQAIHAFSSASTTGLTTPSSLSLGAALPRTTFSGSMPLPSDETLASFGVGNVTVGAIGTNLQIGAPTRTDVSPDGGSFLYDGEYVTIDAIDPITTYTVSIPTVASSSVSRVGHPADGPQSITFLSPPKVVEPADAGDYPLHDRIGWQVPSDAGNALVRIGISANAKDTFSSVWVPAGTHEVVIPELPSTVDTKAFFGEVLATATVALCEPDPSTAGACQRLAESRTLRLIP